MACPYFLPTEKFATGEWRHRTRLPLGDGWRGLCTASGEAQIVPSDKQLREFCNLGYPAGCRQAPQQRRFDAVRFSVTRDREDRIQICYVLEASHHPAAHGMLEYDAAAGCWPAAHPDPRIQAMAACYLESYVDRRQNPATGGAASTRAASEA